MNGVPSAMLAYSRPLYRIHDLRQEYYWHGLAACLPGGSRAFATRSMGGHPVLAALPGRAMDSARVRMLPGAGRYILDTVAAHAA